MTKWEIKPGPKERVKRNNDEGMGTEKVWLRIGDEKWHRRNCNEKPVKKFYENIMSARKQGQMLCERMQTKNIAQRVVSEEGIERQTVGG